MNMKKIISEYLYDKNYFIALYENKLFFYNYGQLLIITDSLIKLQSEKNIYLIKGNNLSIKNLTKEELLIIGNIKEVNKVNA